MHGKQSIVEVDTEELLFKGHEKKTMVGAIIPLIAAPDSLPECFKVISRDERGEDHGGGIRPCRFTCSFIRNPF